jgi:hypothetical protein
VTTISFPLSAGRADVPVIVWKAEPQFSLSRTQKEELSFELGVKLVVQKIKTAPDLNNIKKTQQKTGAVAVVWHDRQGIMNIFFGQHEKKQLITVSSGTMDEKLLYLKELFKLRMGLLKGDMDNLSAASEETDFKPIAKTPYSMPHTAAPKIERWSVAIGYDVKFHFDEVVWPAHGIIFMIPGFRINRLWRSELLTKIGFPTKIGGPDAPWVELNLFEILAKVGVSPLHLKHFDLTFDIALGFISHKFEEFYTDGSSEKSFHISGQGELGLSGKFYFTRNFGLRFFTGVT